MNDELSLAIAEMRSGLFAIEQNAVLPKALNFDDRTDAIDFIEFHIIDRVSGLVDKWGRHDDLMRVMQQAERVKCKLEKANAVLFDCCRPNIQSGECRGRSFNEKINEYCGGYLSSKLGKEIPGYDNLDVFINGLLSGQSVPAPATGRHKEMVFYQKTPARIIFRMVELAQLNSNDVFFDLGSGLGQVTILVHLLSGAVAKGVEYDSAYCNYAQQCAILLNLPNVEFINADARDADYSCGTVFFLYTPFEGSMLQDMLRILKLESQKRTIKIFTYGPCSASVACQSWLSCLNGGGENVYELYEFVSQGIV